MGGVVSRGRGRRNLAMYPCPKENVANTWRISRDGAQLHKMPGRKEGCMMARRLEQDPVLSMVAPSRTHAHALGRGVDMESRWSALARRSAQMLALHPAGSAGRVLIFEPRSAGCGRALRKAGIVCERHAVLRRAIPAMRELKQGYDYLHIWDWTDRLHPRDEGQNDGNDGVEQRGHSTTSALGLFEQIIVSDALRLVHRDQLAELLICLSDFLAPRGFLIVSEPATDGLMDDLQRALAGAGLLREADDLRVEDTWPRIIATFQKRPPDEVKHTGILRRTTAGDLQRHASLRQGLVTTYRDVFGGDEWREWVRCTRPGCGRHYSQREARAFTPPERCVCGWDEPLVPFHTAASVLTKVRQELADDETSCCYLRVARDERVEAFGWGYIASIEHLLAMLAPTDQRAMQATLRTSFGAWLAGMNTTAEHAAVYYHSELGVLEHTRSLSLGCELFRRGLQFASDRGVGAVMLRTSPLTNAAPICFGLGMQVLYRYDRPHDPCLDARDIYPTADVPTDDNRVILGGDVRQLLEVFAGESDRRLALRVGHRLRVGKGVKVAT